MTVNDIPNHLNDESLNLDRELSQECLKVNDTLSAIFTFAIEQKAQHDKKCSQLPLNQDDHFRCQTFAYFRFTIISWNSLFPFFVFPPASLTLLKSKSVFLSFSPHATPAEASQIKGYRDKHRNRNYRNVLKSSLHVVHCDFLHLQRKFMALLWDCISPAIWAILGSFFFSWRQNRWPDRWRHGKKSFN